MTFLSLLLHCPHHYSATKFLCVMNTRLGSIRISHLQPQEILIYPQALSTCTGTVRMGLTGFVDTTKSQTSNLCCVMHSSLLITFVSLMFFSCALLTRMESICVWLPPDEKVISLLLFLRKKVLVIVSLLATQKSRMHNPSWFLVLYPLPP